VSYYSCIDRSIPHSWTIDKDGNKVNDALHMTVTAGAGGIAGHIYCSEVKPKLDPSHWYDDLGSDYIKWEDRATSSNASSRRLPSSRRNSAYASDEHPEQSNGSYSQASGSTAASSSMAQWVPTGLSTLGWKYQWWNGTAYTNDFC